MVYRKRSRKKRTYKKRVFKKRKFSRKKRRNTFSRQLVPNTLAKTLMYSQTFTLDGAVGNVPASRMFSANGIFDPDVTGAFGRQPMGTDIYLPDQYSHYLVVGVKFHCTFLPTNGAPTSGAARVGIIPTGRSADPVTQTVDTLVEQGRGVHRIVGASGQTNMGNTLSFKLNPNKFLGIPNPMGHDDLKGSALANPFEQCNVHIWAGGLNSTINPEELNCVVKIEYKVVFTEPRWQPAS